MFYCYVSLPEGSSKYRCINHLPSNQKVAIVGKIHHRRRSFSHAFQAATEGIRTGHLKGISATQLDEDQRWNESQRNLRPALAPWSYFGNHLLPGCMWKNPAMWSPWAVFCRTQRRSLVLQGRLEPCLRLARRALLQGHFQALSSVLDSFQLKEIPRRTNLNKTWWERVQVHGNREVKPIPSEVMMMMTRWQEQ